ncbi:MAG: hypothetical protein ACTHN5_10750 [Phycisphaerae bacterium]
MKTTVAVLALLSAAALPLLGCETTSSQANAQPAVHDVNVGAQSTAQRVAQVPNDQSATTDNNTPYTLRGDNQRPTHQNFAPIGYNARN